MRFNARLSGYLIGNNSMVDPDVSKRDFKKRREGDISLAIYGNWLLKKSWITSVNYNFSGRVSVEKFQDYSINNGLPLPTTNTMTEGISVGRYTGELEEFDRRNEDIPVYINGKINGSQNAYIGSLLFKSMLGIEFNSKGNRGRGTYYTGSTPQYFRERNYSEVPFMSDISAFAEERITGKLFNRSFEVSAGIRVSKVLLTGYDFSLVTDPRTNFRYSILSPDGSKVFRSATLREDGASYTNYHL